MKLERDDDLANRALNCALISWKTNRKVKDKPPSDYIAERSKNASLGPEIVKQRLKSHRIPYDILIEDNYDNFLKARATILYEDMQTLCEGRIPE